MWVNSQCETYWTQIAVTVTANGPATPTVPCTVHPLLAFGPLESDRELSAAQCVPTADHLRARGTCCARRPRPSGAEIHGHALDRGHLRETQWSWGLACGIPTPCAVAMSARGQGTTGRAKAGRRRGVLSSAQAARTKAVERSRRLVRMWKSI